MVFVGSPERNQMTNGERKQRRQVLLNAPRRPNMRRRNRNTPNWGNHVQRMLDFETPYIIQREFNTPSKPVRRGR